VAAAEDAIQTTTVTPRELLLVAGATARVLRDSSRLADIHIVADIIGRDRFTELLADARASGEPDVMRTRPEIDDREVDFDGLRRLPSDTLGGAYVRHLDRNRLTVYTDPTSDRFIDDPDVRYLIHRYRQTHDIWHVLVGLGTQGHEEVLLHAFIFGLLRLPNSAMIVALGGLKHLLLERRWDALRHTLRDAYRSGKAASPLLMVRWEDHWATSLEDVRKRYCITPITVH